MTERHFAFAEENPRLVNLGANRTPVADDFRTERGVLLVHGFASHCDNLRDLAQFFLDWGYTVFGFNYRSYTDLDSISRSLHDLLSRSVPAGLAHNQRLYAIGHSTGGLVLRRLLQVAPEPVPLRAVAMLGTPNDATLTVDLLRMLLRHIQLVSGFLSLPEAAALGGALIRELTKNDPPPCIIDRMNQVDATAPSQVPFVTVSGGGGPSGRFRVHRRRFWNEVANRRIQRMLGGGPNDGLVLDESVNLGSKVGSEAPLSRHLGQPAYGDWPQLDHSGLKESHIVALLVDEFFRTEVSS